MTVKGYSIKWAGNTVSANYTEYKMDDTIQLFVQTRNPFIQTHSMSDPLVNSHHCAIRWVNMVDILEIFDEERDDSKAA